MSIVFRKVADSSACTRSRRVSSATELLCGHWDTRTDLVTELFSVVGRFRRTCAGRPRGFDLSGITESQAELLRLVGRQPGISVSAAAAELGLAPNTASTLVSKLSTDGLLVRTPDPDDRRVGRLALTAPSGSPTPPGRPAALPSRSARRPRRRRHPRTDKGRFRCCHDITKKCRRTDREHHSAIDCRNLTHRYGDFTAVDNFSLEVQTGETVGLLGPNGAGKTTVVRLLTTLAPIQQGEVRIFGLDARSDTMDIRYNLGYVRNNFRSSRR